MFFHSSLRGDTVCANKEPRGSIHSQKNGLFIASSRFRVSIHSHSPRFRALKSSLLRLNGNFSAVRFRTGNTVSVRFFIYCIEQRNLQHNCIRSQQETPGLDRGYQVKNEIRPNSWQALIAEIGLQNQDRKAFSACCYMILKTVLCLQFCSSKQ